MPCKQPLVFSILVLALLMSAVPPCMGVEDDRASFRYLSPKVGDVGVQTVNVLLDVERQFSQHGAKISDEKQQMQRQQRRRIHVLEVRGMVATRVQVQFERALQQVAMPGKEPDERPLAIHGKTYQVYRAGEQLHVVTTDGRQPPTDERELVEASMAALGRPNPLGQLLDGRTLRQGEKLEAPAELVREFLGDQASGDARMSLTLTEIKGGPTRQTAVFSTELASGGHERGDFGLTMSGRWEVDTATCQTISATFRGPIRALENHGPIGAQYQVTTNGNLDIRVSRVEATATR